jgi:uncharacterized membrane-anchored protein YhcB (DUF1043 family)
MNEIKEQVETTVKDSHGVLATVAGVAVGYIAKRLTKDTAGSTGLGLVVYALIKRL